MVLKYAFKNKGMKGVQSSRHWLCLTLNLLKHLNNVNIVKKMFRHNEFGLLWFKNQPEINQGDVARVEKLERSGVQTSSSLLAQCQGVLSRFR